MRDHNQALIIVDIQNDSCPGGALAVAGGDEIINDINFLANSFSAVILTQDWHPAGHSSFASTHEKMPPFHLTQMDYGPQMLWPDHCVQGSSGAEFHPKLNQEQADMVIRKGFRPHIDSYSAFFENDHETPTGLEGYLRTRGLERLTMVGLALDYCVAYSAIDAAKLGFDVTVIEHCCRAIDLDGSLDHARQNMIAAGVTLEK